MGMILSLRKVSKMAILSIIVALVMMIGTPRQQIHAAEDATKLGITYLKESMKYLYLGIAGKDEYNFSIKVSEQEEGATYSWYVNQEKGNPKAVSINEKSGLAKARKVGTAYIQCIIQRPDGSKINLEARVIVRNAITKIEICNFPLNYTTVVGKPIDFNYIIRKTAAGKGIATEGIVRWEIEKDTTWSEGISTEGVIVPYNEGELTIRAICFHDTGTYENWLRDKKASDITAYSEWVTLKVVAPEGEAIAATSERFEELLKSDKKKITLMSESDLIVSIPKGNYAEKEIIINAPKAVVTNMGSFQKITIIDIAEGGWKEYASGNTIIWKEQNSKLYVTEKAKLSQLDMNKISMVAKVYVDGSIDTILINYPNTLLMATVGVESNDLASATKDKIKVIQSKSTSVATYCFNNNTEGSVIYMNQKIDAVISNYNVSSLEINVADTKYPLRHGSTLARDLSIIETFSYLGKTIPMISSAIYATDVTIGQSLSYAQLLGRFKDTNNNQIAGRLEWNCPNTTITGSGCHTWTFTPEDRSTYILVSGVTMVSLSAKPKPFMDQEVTATSVNAGSPLVNSIISGDFKDMFGNVVEGTLVWFEPSAIVNYTSYYAWRFLPSNTTVYDMVTGMIKVTVN